MTQDRKDVAIVGGGISGLTAAWYLKNAGLDVALLEATPSVGGCTRTERRDGFLLEKGPFNVIVRDPTFEALLDWLSDEVHVVNASREARVRYIYRRGRLYPVPKGLVTSRLMSFSGRCRLFSGLFMSRRAGAEEETIEQVATRRFGREMSDAVVSAGISGIFAGDITRLSLRACFPSVARVDAEARSLFGYGLKKAFKKKGGHRRRWRGLVSIDGGLGALTDMLGRRLGETLLSGCQVDRIRSSHGSYELDYRDAQGVAQSLPCDRLVLASPAAETARLLQPHLPETAESLQSIESASLVVLNLGYRQERVGHPLEGFGFLVPHDERDYPLMGVLWADSIFPHYAPPDHRLLRVFIGGACNPGAVERTDDELLATAADGMRELLQISGDPMLIDVCRYPAAIPQYYCGHTERVQRIRADVATQPGLTLIGNYLEGVSLNDCVRLATNAASDILQAKGQEPTRSQDHGIAAEPSPTGATAAPVAS